MFGKLVAYKQLHRDCQVPRRYPQDRSIGAWVSTQRYELKNAPEDNDWRRPKLESLGLDWRVREKRASWDQMLRRLVAYKQQNGNCNVPQCYPQDKSLEISVNTQQSALKHAPENTWRRQRLESIGST